MNWNTLQFKQFNGPTIDLADCGDYCADYTPSVSYRTKSVLGNRSDYADVIDTLRIVARGESQLSAIRKLQAVVSLITQAERWSEGENINPVLLVARESADGAILQSVVIGGDASQFADVSDQYADTLNGMFRAEVVLSIKRRGVWCAESPIVYPVDAGEISAVLTATSPIAMYDAVAQTSSLLVSLEPNGPNFDNIPQSFYVITARSGKLVGQPTPLGFISGSWALALNPTALSGQVQVTSSPSASLYYDLSATTIGSPRFVALFAYVRRGGSSGGSCIIRARSLENRFPDTDFVNVPSLVPSLVPLGTVEVVDAIQNVVVEVKNFGGAELYIERVVAVEVDNENTHIVEMINAYNPFAAGPHAQVIDNSPTRLYPTISATGTPFSFYGRGSLAIAFSVPIISAGVYGGDTTSWRACSNIELTVLAYQTKLIPD